MNFDNILLNEFGEVTGCMNYEPLVDPLDQESAPMKVQITRLTGNNWLCCYCYRCCCFCCWCWIYIIYVICPCIAYFTFLSLFQPTRTMLSMFGLEEATLKWCNIRKLCLKYSYIVHEVFVYCASSIRKLCIKYS